MTGRPLFVLGAGGHGKVVADVGRSAGHVLRAFVDDAPDRQGGRIWDLPVLSWEALLEKAGAPGALVALGIGDSVARERAFSRLVAAGLEVATLVHAAAVVAPTATLGEGAVLMAGALVNPDAVIGRGAIVNTGAVVEHDCRVGAFAHLSPNAALGGKVTVGDRTHLGLGAVALPGVRIGSDVRVGAGAVVHRDVADGVTVVGVPARPLGENA
jgi:sugar O-acyltransferase (sialic acid O-acetyltransferase NeuD family)